MSFFLPFLQSLYHPLRSVLGYTRLFLVVGDDWHQVKPVITPYPENKVSLLYYRLKCLLFGSLIKYFRSRTGQLTE